jgi:hypothetical protein
MEYSYFKIFNEDGSVAGVGAVEKGSDYEVYLINEILELKYSLVKISKEEFDAYDEGDEIKNF